MIKIKYKGAVVEICIDGMDTVAELNAALQDRTGVLARRQKLLCRGKVVQAQQTLTVAGVSPGATLMLLNSGAQAAASSAAVVSKGAQMLAEMRTQRAQREAECRSGSTSVPPFSKRPAVVESAAAIDRRLKFWRDTRVANLEDVDLGVPPQLPVALVRGEVARLLVTLEASNCQLPALPEHADWEALRRLVLSHNSLEAVPSTLGKGKIDEGRRLDGSANALALLAFLDLSHNPIASFPASLRHLSGLVTLRLSHARLAFIPACVQDLASLEELDVSFNRLEALPDELGSCCKLRVVVADENEILSLPESLKALQALRALSARHNRIAAVPSAILLECSSLQTIDVHGNPLTMQALRDTPGFAEFDARRRAKYSKQMDMRVLLRGSFDEGADVEEWERTREKR